jgi:uncharacterized membrane protein YvlD (DUF360 family)
MLAGQNNPQPVRVQDGTVGRIPLRVGLYAGVALSILLTAWIFVANHVPFLEPYSRERNLTAATLMVLFALLPIVRYSNAPRALLAAGLVAWGILSFVYSLVCVFLPRLSAIRTPLQVLMLGALFYLISATVAWMVALVWKVRQSRSPHSHLRH